LRSVVVTGADGFVGRRVATALQADGLTVAGTSRRASGGPLKTLDVTDVAAVRAFFRGLPQQDAVVHLAAIAHPRRRHIPPAEFDRVNHLGFRHVMDEAIAAGVRRVVFFSSAVVYGADRGRGVTEDAPRRPVGPYAHSKRDAEDRCFEAIAAGREVVVFRFPVIYGQDFLADLRVRAYVPFTGGRLLLRIVGAQPAFSLCSVENAADAVRYALGGTVPAGVYNIADRCEYPQEEVRQTIASIDGVRPALPIPAALATASVRLVTSVVPGGIRDAVRAQADKLFTGATIDTTRIRRLGFVPRHTLEELRVRAHQPAQATASC
jgi:nucleoside-diphosphate-sugar epimerase